MKIRPIALCAMAGLCACLHAASNFTAAKQQAPPLAIYYSFEAPPSDNVLNEMQFEMARILGAAGLHVAWRDLGRTSGEEVFREVVVMRFRGGCAYSRAEARVESGSEVFGTPLAETDLADGHVLPFGEVQCDRLRSYLAPAERDLSQREGEAALGRAMARVAAHEIYHMLTGSASHALEGIARAEHSRAELTASRFDFGGPEVEWLRAWALGSPAEDQANRPAVLGTR